jgi:hypothetical protein
MPNGITRREGLSNIAFRLTAVLLAIFLGAQCIWLMLAGLSRPGIDQLPTDATSAAAAAAAGRRYAATWAASIGAVRGDLWAESAFTYANLVIDGGAASASPNLAKTLALARASLDHALDNAPSQSGVWLLLAGLAMHYPSTWPAISPIQALKMSYYTGPSVQRLIPLRLRLAVHADQFGDFEMSQFVNRDLRLLLSQKQIAAISAAYVAASPDGKRFIEQTVSDVDPSLLATLRAGVWPSQVLPVK